MPIEARFDEDRQLLHVVLSGEWPTLPEIIGERSRLIMAGYIRPGVVELVDARGVTRGIPNLNQIRSILHAIGTPPIKRAVVVSSSVEFSAGRVAAALSPEAVRVFGDEPAALEWLFADRPASRVSDTTSHI